MTAPFDQKKLYKSRRNRFIDGVCGGIAEYFDVDPTIVRLLWVIITLLGGAGFVLYIIAMIIMPVNPEHLFFPLGMAPPGTPQGSPAPPAPHPGSDKRRFFGIVLILIGAFLLLANLGWIADWGWWMFSKKVMLPIFVIAVGVLLIYIYTARRETPASVAGVPGDAPGQVPRPRELRRSLTDRKLFGVCGGIALYFGIDSTIVRILFVVLALASFGWILLLYIVMGFVMPEERPAANSPF
jgi:phage shock protein C